MSIDFSLHRVNYTGICPSTIVTFSRYVYKESFRLQVLWILFQRFYVEKKSASGYDCTAFTCLTHTCRPVAPQLRPLEDIPVLWDMTACRLVNIYRRFRGTCCLHIQDIQRKSKLDLSEDVDKNVLWNTCNYLKLTRRHIPGDLNRLQHRFENLQSHMALHRELQCT
jgi:hypothetical protein